MKRATIKDVAREAGVSISAVSRAFSEGSIAPETQARVLDAAGRLGYRPSQVARGLVQSRTNTITLVTGRMTDPFDALFLEHLAEALADRRMRLVVTPASRRNAESGGLLQALDDRSDAVIVAAGTMPLDQSDLCLKAGLPVILAGRMTELAGIDAVAAENADGGRQAAELFLRTGCRSLAYFGLAHRSFSDSEREGGFVLAARRKGYGAHVFRARPEQDEFEAASAMLTAEERPDAVFCSNDRLAATVLDTARALGLSVPRELSVIGFNNIPLAARRGYHLTTLDYPPQRVVAEILEMFDRRLADPDGPAQVRRIPVSLVLRGSTREIAA